jgi:membrane protein YdbS with pleckstrin-like domain
MSEPTLERRISSKAFLGSYLIAAAVGVAVALGVLLTNLSAYWYWLALAPLPLLAVYVYVALIRAGTSYKLFPDRLEVESGLFNRKIENLELFRVRDVGLRQGFLGRIFNFGDLYVHSTDSSAPDLHITGIDSPKDFYQDFRGRVTASRASARTMIVEEGQSIAEP